MKKTLLALAVLLGSTFQAHAIDDNTVEIVYSGETATVTIADNISDYVTLASGTSSHVILIQSTDFAGVDATTDNEDGEIFYRLSGTSTDGSFYLTGSYKCTVTLKGVTLTNPTGPALNIQNGKRVAVSVNSNTVNTLTDGANEDYNGCLHCKGHVKLKGKGTLNIVGNSKHALYCKEYLEVKNLTLNVTGSVKDGIHCREYMLVESGTISIANAGDDAIQVELDGTTSTGTTTGHEDEDSGNFYMTGGKLTISDCTGYDIKADGTISLTGGTHNFDTTNILADALNVEGITPTTCHLPLTTGHSYDLLGRPSSGAKSGKGLRIVSVNGRRLVVAQP